MSTHQVSETSIANAALTLLGERRIDSLEADSKTAKLLKERFAEVRDDTLRSYPWSFATRRASLASNATPPVWQFDYAYDFPTDLLRLVNVDNPGDQPYRVEGRKIVTDMGPPINIEYTACVTDVSQMDVLFRQAFAAALALDLAEAVAGTSTKVEELREAFKQKLRAARTPDSQEPSVRVIEASDWLDSREETGFVRRIDLSDDGFPL